MLSRYEERFGSISSSKSSFMEGSISDHGEASKNPTPGK